MRTGISLFLFLCTLTAAWAQKRDCAPGCVMKPAGNYFIELAGCNEYLDIYVYDIRKVPLRNVTLAGAVEFYYPDESVARAELIQYYTTNRLSARIAGPGFRNCRVLLQVNGKDVSALFQNECELRASTPLRSTAVQ
jgi:hypothetical protein